MFYRLNVVPLNIPALNERIEDIPELIDYFLNVCSKDLGVANTNLSKEGYNYLQSRKWSGNIRELKRLTVWSVRLLLAAGLPIIAVIIIFPGKILSLFGSEYTQGALVLIILAFGQLVNIMTGSVAMLLSMTKYEKMQGYKKV